MIEKIRTAYDKHLSVKITVVTFIVLLSTVVMLPILKIAEQFGVNIREHTGLNFKVAPGNIFFFFLFGICSIGIVWLAQKHIHKQILSELGLRTKFWSSIIIGFTAGTILVSLRYLVLALSAENVTYTSTIPEDVSIASYIGYYLYFMVGFIFWNSFIEELGSRSYPIQKLKNHVNPHIIFVIMGLLFTVVHFVLNDFNFGYFLSLFIFSYVFSLLYYYSGSIWLIVGMHSGVNWLGFSFFGTNWKLGALCEIEISGTPNWIVDYSNVIIQLSFLLLVIYLYKKGFFAKYFPIPE